MKDVFHLGGYINEECFAADSLTMLQASVQATIETRWETIRSPHIFMGILNTSHPAITAWCQALETDPYQLLRQFQSFFQQTMDEVPFVRLHREFCSTNTLEILRSALRRSLALNQPTVRPTDMLWALLSDDSCISACFKECGYTPSVLRVLLCDIEGKRAPYPV